VLRDHIRFTYDVLGHKGHYSQVHAQDRKKEGIYGKLDRRLIEGEKELLEWCEKFDGKADLFIGRNPRNKEGKVEKITCFSIDIDPIKPKGAPASVKQLNIALQAGKEALRIQPGGHLSSSGNGSQVFWPLGSVETQYEQGIKNLESIIRKHIEGKFHVKVDSIYDSSRLVKIIGTRATKGEVKQHRHSKWITSRNRQLGGCPRISEAIRAYSEAQPQKIVAPLPKTAGVDRSVLDYGFALRLKRDGLGDEDIRSVLQNYGYRAPERKDDLERIIAKISKDKNGEGSEEIRSLGIDEFLDEGDSEVKWLVNGIFAERGLGFIAGLGETRKSWILMDLAVEMAKGGGYWLGKFPVKDGKVMYIDQERPAVETRRRFKMLLNAKNLNKKDLKDTLHILCGTTINITHETSFNALKRKIDHFKPDIILVDSFVTIHGKEENNRTEIQNVFEKAKKLRNEYGCGIVFLDHESKAILNPMNTREPNAHDMLGSSAKVAAAEAVLTVRKDGTESSIVYHTKSTMGKTIEPFMVRLEDIGTDGISVKAY